MQTHLAKNGITSLGRLVLLADDIAGMREAMKDCLGMDAGIMDERNLISDVIQAWSNAKAITTRESEAVAEARISEKPRMVPKADHKLLQQAYTKIYGKILLAETPGRYYLGTKLDQAVENDPRVEKLTEVTCKLEHEPENLTPV